MIAASSSAARNGIHVFEVGRLICRRANAGAESRLELLSGVEEDIEDARGRARRGFADAGEVFMRSMREGWEAVGCGDFDHVRERDSAGGSVADEAP